LDYSKPVTGLLYLNFYIAVIIKIRYLITVVYDLLKNDTVTV